MLHTNKEDLTFLDKTLISEYTTDISIISQGADLHNKIACFALELDFYTFKHVAANNLCGMTKYDVCR